MRAGQLRHRVTIETTTEVQDQYGEPVETWTTLAEVWASREDLAGREAFAAQQVQADVTTRFQMRFLAGVTAKARLISDGVTYNVTSVADADGRGKTLTLLAAREG
jgi:SPP1 family predicted phage head-tail adaptor